MERWRIRQRYPQPDWSIVDLWVAKRLLSQGWAPTQVQLILRLASPQFPRRHSDPEDYLRRTIARAVFPARLYSQQALVEDAESVNFWLG
jgi:hypothetical protein